MIPWLFFNVLVSLVCKHPFSYSACNLTEVLWIHILKTWRVFIEIVFTISRRSVFYNFFVRSSFNKALHSWRTVYFLEASIGRVFWSLSGVNGKAGGDRAEGRWAEPRASAEPAEKVGSWMQRETCNSAVLGALWEKPPIRSIGHLWGYPATTWCLGTDTVVRTPVLLRFCSIHVAGPCYFKAQGLN